MAQAVQHRGRKGDPPVLLDRALESGVIGIGIAAAWQRAEYDDGQLGLRAHLDAVKRVQPCVGIAREEELLLQRSLEWCYAQDLERQPEAERPKRAPELRRH